MKPSAALTTNLLPQSISRMIQVEMVRHSLTYIVDNPILISRSQTTKLQRPAKTPPQKLKDRNDLLKRAGVVSVS